MIVVPKTYNGDLANLPEALTPLVLCSRWLIWRWEQAKNGKFTKPPYIATDPGRHAANNDPSTWGPYKDAVSAVHAGRAHGIGFSLTGSDYAAIDLDDCRDPETGKIAAWAQDIIDRAPGAYVEITVSGTGLRILGVAAGAEAHRRFVVTAEAGVEVFRKATRYITISCIQIGECVELTNIDAPIDYVSEMYGQPKPNGQSNSTADAGLFDGPILTGNDRSVDFHKLVWSCAGMGMSVDEIERELRTDHAGVIEKYLRPKDRLRKEIERCLSKRAHAQPKTDAAEEKGFVWPEPKPIPAGLQPVDSFNLDFLPEALKPWVGDVSERLQCPPDYVGISAVVALGSVIGRRMGIKPQQQTDWVEIPNVWGCFIGRPGTLKSPAMNEALRFVHRLEIEAAKENEVAVLAYKANINEYKLKQQVKVSLEKARMKKADSDAKKFKIELDVGEEPQEPKPRRYCTNDSSYEALGELLRDNPNGILVERDELISLLKHLDREEQVVARSFYLFRHIRSALPRLWDALAAS